MSSAISHEIDPLTLQMKAESCFIQSTLLGYQINDPAYASSVHEVSRDNWDRHLKLLYWCIVDTGANKRKSDRESLYSKLKNSGLEHLELAFVGILDHLFQVLKEATSYLSKDSKGGDDSTRERDITVGTPEGGPVNAATRLHALYISLGLINRSFSTLTMLLPLQTDAV